MPRTRRSPCSSNRDSLCHNALSCTSGDAHHAAGCPRRLREHPDSSSPSGHTAAAVAFSVAVAPVWPAAEAARGAGAALMAAQRLHGGAHYPSDVAAGGTIGLAAGGGGAGCTPTLMGQRLRVLGRAIRTTRHARRRR
ncbi:phosphatase PAP2 family protein [Streptomyces sp. NPDC002265]|uniref:phosphatase PAP2 family protein n=1 Tax=Streptomyces sp. NPDC002265 TaxID=3154415 RepID=UPI003333FEEB